MSEEITIDNIKSLIVKAGDMEIICPDGHGYNCTVLLDGKPIHNYIEKMNILIRAGRSVEIDLTIVPIVPTLATKEGE